MRRILTIVCIVGWLVGCSRSTPTPEPTTVPTDTPSAPAGVIVAMGDSLTEGFGLDMDDAYPAQLERKLQEEGYNFSVINAGNSGETSSGALTRVDWVLTLEPDIVILAIGGNDGLRGIDVGLTEQNIDQLLRTFLEQDIIVVFPGMEIVQNMGEEYTDAFRALYPHLAEQHDVIFMPFFLEGVAADPELNQADFIHPNTDGYAVVVETLTPYVIEAIQRLPTDN